jgi:hypothetical protein
MAIPEKHIVNLVIKSETAILSGKTNAGNHGREAQQLFDQLADAELKKFGARLVVPITKQSLAEELAKALKNAPNAKYVIERGTHLGINAITPENLPAFVPTEEGSALKAWQNATNCSEINDVRSALADLIASPSAAQLRELIAINQGRLAEALDDGFITVPTPVGEIKVAFKLGVWPTTNKESQTKQPLFEEHSLPLMNIYSLSLEELSERNQLIDPIVEVIPEHVFDPQLNGRTKYSNDEEDMITLNPHSIQLSKITKRDVYKIVRRQQFDQKNQKQTDHVSVIVLPYAIAQTLNILESK